MLPDYDVPAPKNIGRLLERRAHAARKVREVKHLLGRAGGGLEVAAYEDVRRGAEARAERP